MTARKASLDQVLLGKIAQKMKKTPQYIREQIARRASREGITSEAAQVVWAKELKLGTAARFRQLPSHVQTQVRDALVPAAPPIQKRSADGASNGRPAAPADPVLVATDYLISDDELKDRCRDLLKKKRHLDRVFREATTVLETRIKRRGQVKTHMLPEALVNTVLNPDPEKAVLRVSTQASEQQGFHSVCRGIVLAFRNPAHHSLDDQVTPERALKFCGFVDILLDMVERADYQPPSRKDEK